MELGKTKAKIERYAKENNVDVQVAWDSFSFDEFLHRISLSDYKDKYVFKGGFYLQKVLGSVLGVQWTWTSSIPV